MLTALITVGGFVLYSMGAVVTVKEFYHICKAVLVWFNNR